MSIVVNKWDVVIIVAVARVFCFIVLLGCECLFVCLFWPSFASGSQLTVEKKLLISTLNKDTLLIRKFNKRTDAGDGWTDGRTSWIIKEQVWKVLQMWRTQWERMCKEWERGQQSWLYVLFCKTCLDMGSQL